MLFPPGFDQAIALEAGALVNQAYEQYDKFTANQPWNIQGRYEMLGLLSAKPECAWAPGKSPSGSSHAVRYRATCLSRSAARNRLETGWPTPAFATHGRDRLADC
jgi:hypothetical protein